MNQQKQSISLDGLSVPVKSLIISDMNVLQVTAGTNGYQGGDSGHGGRTILKIEDLASTDLRVKVKERSRGTASELIEADSVEIVLGGDAELDTFIRALEFAVQTLKEQTKEG